MDRRPQSAEGLTRRLATPSACIRIVRHRPRGRRRRPCDRGLAGRCREVPGHASARREDRPGGDGEGRDERLDPGVDALTLPSPRVRAIRHSSQPLAGWLWQSFILRYEFPGAEPGHSPTPLWLRSVPGTGCGWCFARTHVTTPGVAVCVHEGLDHLHHERPRTRLAVQVALAALVGLERLVELARDSTRRASRTAGPEPLQLRR